jgi:hypothetical protein
MIKDYNATHLENIPGHIIKPKVGIWRFSDGVQNHFVAGGAVVWRNLTWQELNFFGWREDGVFVGDFHP